MGPPFLTSALDGGERSNHALAALSQGKSPRYSLERRPGGPEGHCGAEKDLFPLPGTEPRSSGT
jgi:hypothetical protein